MSQDMLNDRNIKALAQQAKDQQNKIDLLTAKVESLQRSMAQMVGTMQQLQQAQVLSEKFSRLNGGATAG